MDILKKKMKTRDKRRSLAIASIPYKWRRSCHASDDLPKPGDPAYDEQGVLRGYRSHGGPLVVRGQLGEEEGGGRDVSTLQDGFTAIGEQSAHHWRTTVYEDDKRRDVVMKASRGQIHRCGRGAEESCEEV